MISFTFSYDQNQKSAELQKKQKGMMMIMPYQHIPPRHIPTRWEYVIMNRGGNVTLSYSHHIYIHHYHYG